MTGVPAGMDVNKLPKIFCYVISRHIACTASQLARFCASSGPLHWAALHHVMGYHDLEQNPSFKLPYQRRCSNGLDGFADSDLGNSITRTTGLLARFNSWVVIWRSKMQKTVSLSTAEAEYFSASETRRWLSRCCTSTTYLKTWGLRTGRHPTFQCTRTTQPAWSEVTT